MLQLKAPKPETNIKISKKTKGIIEKVSRNFVSMNLFNLVAFSNESVYNHCLRELERQFIASKLKDAEFTFEIYKKMRQELSYFFIDCLNKKIVLGDYEKRKSFLYERK